MLGTNVSASATWEIKVSMEQSADPAFLLPVNANLAGQTIAKFVLTNRTTGDVYYFEFPLPNAALYAQYRAIAYTPIASNRDGVNDGIHWYLNHRTVDGAANNISVTGARAGFAYNMTRVTERIGRTSVQQAFSDIAALPAADQPTNQIERINLFLTTLKDVSGQDIIGMFSSQE